MAVPTTEQTAEEAQQEQQKVSQQRDNLQKELSSDFAKSLDLPQQDEQKDEARVTPEDFIKKEEEEEDYDQALQEEDEEEEEAEVDEEDEELIAKSKVDKRFARMTAEKQALEDRIAQLESKIEASKDPEIAKLEKLSTTELESLMTQIEDAKFDAMTSQDRDKYNQLVTLGRNANKVLRTAPDRLAKEQSKAYQLQAAKIEADMDVSGIDSKTASKEIMAIANEIYGESKPLQNDKNGQAEALRLAYNHYKRVVKLSDGKSTVKQLKRDNNKLKRRTSLDGKVMKGDKQRKTLSKLRERAISHNASTKDKLNFAKHSGMLGDLSRYENLGR